MASSTKNLKIKIITKKPDPSTFEFAKPPLTKFGYVVTANRSKKIVLGIVKSCGAHGSEDRKTVTDCYGKQLQSVCGTKRGPEEMIDCRSGKRLKMDRILVRRCFMIVKKLMTHPCGPPFNQPVDPVALNIPDYFSVISKPMDLGTIKSKLEKDLYATADKFEADIRLTFSNAMKFNPPGNPFHKMAQELNSFFSAQWRFVGSIMERESIEGDADNGLNDGGKKLENVTTGCIRMSPHTGASPRRLTLATEKMNVEGSKQESVGKVLPKIFRTIEEEENQISKAAVSKLSHSSAVSLGTKSSVQVKNVCCSSMHSDALHKRPTESTKRMEPKKKMEASIGKKVTWSSTITSDLKAPSGAKSLVQVGNVCYNSMHSDVLHKRPTESTKKMESKRKKEASIGKKFTLSSARTSNLKAPSIDLKTLEKTVHVENVCCNSMHSDVLRKRPTESTKKMEPKKKKEASIGKKVTVSSARTSDLKAPSSDLKTLEKTVHEVANKHKPLEKCDPYASSEGALSWLEKEPTFNNHHAAFASAAFDCNDWRFPVCEIQLSPSKAMRAEMLKRRFADTIFKAQKQTLLCPGDKIDQLKMEVEKQKLERQHAEEKLKTEDGVKASGDRQMSNCELQRQREREAARIALEKMERSVEFEDNITSLRDLADMIGDFSFAGPLRGYGGMYVATKQFVNGKLKSPLERLGLYLKEEKDDEYMFGDDQGHDRDTLPEDYEEGEIIM